MRLPGVRECACALVCIVWCAWRECDCDCACLHVFRVCGCVCCVVCVRDVYS